MPKHEKFIKYRHALGALSCLYFGFIYPVVGYAQSKEQGIKTPTNAETITGISGKMEIHPKSEEKTLLGSVYDYLHTQGQNLIDTGIYPKAFFASTYYGNAVGGITRQDIGYNEAFYGADFDMEKLAGWDGGIIRIALDSRFGGQPSGVNNLTGSTVTFFHGSGPNNTTRLNQLVIEQHLLDDRLRFTVGRTQLASFFATSQLYCMFMIGMCSNLNPITWSSNSNSPFWPISVWGGEVTFIPTENTYVRIGAEESNVAQYTKGGFPWHNGWGIDTATGAYTAAEVGYEYPGWEEGYNGRYDIGFYNDTSDVDDFQYTANGQKLAFTHGTPRRYSLQNGLYLQFEQKIWAPKKNGPQGTTLFGGMVFDTSGHSLQQNYFLLGAVQYGTFPGRDDDYFAMKVASHTFNGRAIGYLNDSLIVNKQGGQISRTEQVMEVDYSVECMDGVRLQPFVAMVFHPDQLVYNLPSPKRDVTFSFSGGVQLSIVLAQAIGLPGFGLGRPY
ncbi:carbohydrate porin [Entomobacter blattae]|uniref:Carbohydrate-selective porin, OprB family n=1 Tax=Entomobacter blattae TaxID=2762277 RepID=A0A7H1NU85_9PROT|nr:carbohydrate porin [Entomobacter blattae]QNT79345.1 Carbohydrate-selective porin, OprB family [Entomobacter blattae]